MRLLPIVVASLAIAVAPALADECDPIELSCNGAITVCSSAEVGIEHGASVGVAGVWGIAGAYQYKINGQAGAPEGGAFLYQRTGTDWPPAVGSTCAWTHQQTIVADDATPGQWFGFSVAMDFVAVIGAPALQGGSPAAYVFTYNGSAWSQAARLTPSIGNDPLFGRSVAVDGDLVAVSSATAVYVFKKSSFGWFSMNETARLTPSAVGASVSAVAIDNGAIAALVHFPTDTVHVFEESVIGWIDATEDVILETGFGQFDLEDVDMWANWIVAGGNAPGVEGKGFVWTKQNGQWANMTSATAELTPAFPNPTSGFGHAVAINHELILIGDDSGDMHAYVRPPWCAEGWQDATESAALPGDLGWRIDVDSAGTIMQGNPDDPGPPESPAGGVGSIQFVNMQDCNNDGIVDLCPPPFNLQAVPYEPIGGLTAIDDITAVAVDPAQTEAVVLRHTGGTWNELALLTPADAVPDDAFGAAVDGDGPIIVVGAPDHDGGENDAGGAYVYVRGADWVSSTEASIIYPPDPVDGQRFGHAVAVHGHRVVIGTDEAMAAGEPGIGAAYVYEQTPDGWVGIGAPEPVALTPSDGKLGDLFGRAVAIYGDVIVVGSPFASINGFEAGAAYVYRWNGGAWTEDAQLFSPFGEEGAHFGSAVTIFGDTVAVGAPDALGGLGAAFVYEFDGADWNEVGLSSCAIANGGAFGSSLDINAELLFVGAPLARGGAGVVYGFVHDPDAHAWTAVGLFESPQLDSGDGLGSDVSIREQTLLLSTAQSGLGFAVLELADCNGNGIVDPIEIQLGLAADVNANGQPDDCECLADIDGNGSVGLTDVVAVLSDWGPCAPCSSDLDGDGFVGFTDLVAVLSAWGPCV